MMTIKGLNRHLTAIRVKLLIRRKELLGDHLSFVIMQRLEEPCRIDKGVRIGPTGLEPPAEAGNKKKYPPHLSLFFFK